MRLLERSFLVLLVLGKMTWTEIGLALVNFHCILK